MKPAGEPATRNGQTYFVTALTSERRPYFRYERWADLFLETLFRYRDRGEFLVHAYVVMPDHVHLLITPSETLERAVQLFKGGFSREATKQFQPGHEIWQRGFSDHRVRDLGDYERHAMYIGRNPVKAKLCDRAEDYLYSSVLSKYVLDPVPQGLKPLVAGAGDGTAEAVPFQGLDSRADENVLASNRCGEAKANPIPQGLKPLVAGAGDGTAEAVAFQRPDSCANENVNASNRCGEAKADPVPQGLKPLVAGAGNGTAEAVPFQRCNPLVAAPAANSWSASTPDRSRARKPLNAAKANMARPSGLPGAAARKPVSSTNSRRNPRAERA